MAPLWIPLTCLAALFVAGKIDPVGSPMRLGLVAAVGLSFSLKRPLLGGTLRSLPLLAGSLAALAGWGLGGSPNHVLAHFLEGGLLGVFLALLDILTLRRTLPLRLYNFTAVLTLVQGSWYLMAVWLPGLQFPCPDLLPSLLAEVLAGVALALACVLAAPPLEMAGPPRRRKPIPRTVHPEELVLVSWAGEVTPGSEHRDTMPGPPEVPQG